MVGFLLLLLFIKLALADASIEIVAISKAAIGALVAAGSVLIVDDTSLARRLEHFPRIVAVVIKTFVYGVFTLFLGYLERIVEAIYRVRYFDLATRARFVALNS
jgi:hypothetical protein